MKTSLPVRALLENKGRAVFSVHPRASVYDAIVLMAEKSIGALLVMDDNFLRGIISERDYTRKVILQGKSSKDTAVEDIMSRRVVTATPLQSVEECMRIMTDNRIRHLPVVDLTGVIGVVSIGDLVKWTLDAQREKIDELHSFIAGAYPG